MPGWMAEGKTKDCIPPHCSSEYSRPRQVTGKKTLASKGGSGRMRIMGILVLDKSVVQAARRGVLSSLRGDFEFLLTGTLLHEMGTQGLAERDGLLPHEEVRLDQGIRTNFIRTIEEAGNRWIASDDALRWEVEEGRSARYAPRRSLKVVPCIGMLSDTQRMDCLSEDQQMGLLVSVSHAVGDGGAFAAVRRLSKSEFYAWIETNCSPGAADDPVATEARDLFAAVAKCKGLQVSSNFRPRRDWLAFGLIHSWKSFLAWKFWKYGDDAPDRKKPANPYRDIIYRAFVSIADGLLSADKDLLRLTWACWPEKRDSIYSYDMTSHAVVLFEPDWSS